MTWLRPFFYVRTPQSFWKKGVSETGNDETENNEPTHQQAKQTEDPNSGWLKVKKSLLGKRSRDYYFPTATGFRQAQQV